MNRNYETTDAAPMNYNDPKHNLLAQAKMQASFRAQQSQGVSEGRMTELESLLSTLRSHAIEIRSHVAQMFNRIVPQPENDCAEKQAFNGGYIGQAEEIRSIQSEVIRMVAELSKYA